MSQPAFTQMQWPSWREWEKLEPSERLVLAAHLVKEARERAFETRTGLSSNEERALAQLMDALTDCGYELQIATEHAFRRRQETP